VLAEILTDEETQEPEAHDASNASGITVRTFSRVHVLQIVRVDIDQTHNRGVVAKEQQTRPCEAKDT